MTTRTRHFWIEVAVFAAVVIAVAAAMVASEMRPLNKNDIKMNVSDIRSFAAAAGELNRHHSNGQLTERFFETQIELIADKVSSTRSALETAATPDAESDRVAAADLAGRLEAAVHRLEHGSSEAQLASPDLDLIRTEAKTLEERLSQ